MTGTLFVVSTPIGNMEDITLRALRVLKEVDLIACEDTRHTRKLLARYDLSTHTVSYHQHNEVRRTPELIARLMNGESIALVSDAGTPLVSDPGYRLVRSAIEHGIRVEPIPGPSALVTALSASGLPPADFTFVGFLPARAGRRRERLKALATLPGTLIIYEAPHRILETLKDALHTLGDRECVVARELTKVHEEFVRGRTSEVLKLLEGRSQRGEMVLMLGPPLPNNRVESPESIRLEFERLVGEKGLDRKSALRRLATARGLKRREVYRLLIEEGSTIDDAD